MLFKYIFLDWCGICDGDNSTCKEISGDYTPKNESYGYHLAVTIPSGASNVKIVQRNFSDGTNNSYNVKNSFLALKDVETSNCFQLKQIAVIEHFIVNYLEHLFRTIFVKWRICCYYWWQRNSLRKHEDFLFRLFGKAWNNWHHQNSSEASNCGGKRSHFHNFLGIILKTRLNCLHNQIGGNSWKLLFAKGFLQICDFQTG